MKVYFKITDMELHRFTKNEERVLCLDLTKTWISYKYRKVDPALHENLRLTDPETGQTYFGPGYKSFINAYTLLRINWRNITKSWGNIKYSININIPKGNL